MNSVQGLARLEFRYRFELDDATVWPMPVVPSSRGKELASAQLRLFVRQAKLSSFLSNIVFCLSQSFTRARKVMMLSFIELMDSDSLDNSLTS